MGESLAAFRVWWSRRGNVSARSTRGVAGRGRSARGGRAARRARERRGAGGGPRPDRLRGRTPHRAPQRGRKDGALPGAARRALRRVARRPRVLRGPAGFLRCPSGQSAVRPGLASPGITAQRLETLSSLATAEDGTAPRVVLTTVRGLLQRVPKPERLAEAVLRIRVGALPPDTALAHLVQLGYERFPRLNRSPLRAARRHPRHLSGRAGDPIRLEFDGNTVSRCAASMPPRSAFRSSQLENAVVPRHEVLLNAETRRRWPRTAQGRPACRKGSSARGPLRSARGSLLDYLPQDLLVIAADPGAPGCAARAGRGNRAQYQAQQGTTRPLAARLAVPAASALTEALRRPAGTGWDRSARPMRRPAQAFVDCRPAEPMQRSMGARRRTSPAGGERHPRGDPVRQHRTARPAGRADRRRHRGNARGGIDRRRLHCPAPASRFSPITRSSPAIAAGAGASARPAGSHWPSCPRCVSAISWYTRITASAPIAG
jgi:hypothetical protein